MQRPTAKSEVRSRYYLPLLRDALFGHLRCAELSVYTGLEHDSKDKRELLRRALLF